MALPPRRLSERLGDGLDEGREEGGVRSAEVGAGYGEKSAEPQGRGAGEERGELGVRQQRAEQQLRREGTRTRELRSKGFVVERQAFWSQLKWC